MIRIYYNFMELEEYTEGMWRIIRGEERKKYISASAKLMMNVDKFYDAMCTAIQEWPKSCEHNFTTESMNRIAWLGHAGCCIEVGSPEDCTRAAWYWLTDEQMEEANHVAAVALSKWSMDGPQMALGL